MNLFETLGRLAHRRLIKSAGSVFTLLDGYTPSFTSWRGCNDSCRRRRRNSL